MPDTARQNEATAPGDARVVALVNGPKLVQLWGPNNKPVYVEAGDVDEYTSMGYSTSSVDLADVGKDLIAKVATFQRAVAAYVKSTVDDRIIDPSDDAAYHVAEVAAAEASEAWGVYRQQSLIQCEVIEPDPEKVTLPDGTTVNHDPSQVLLFHPLDGARAFTADEADVRVKKYGWSKEPPRNA